MNVANDMCKLSKGSKERCYQKELIKVLTAIEIVANRGDKQYVLYNHKKFLFDYIDTERLTMDLQNLGFNVELLKSDIIKHHWFRPSEKYNVGFDLVIKWCCEDEE